MGIDMWIRECELEFNGSPGELKQRWLARALKGEAISFDYWKIDFENAIVTFADEGYWFRWDEKFVKELKFLAKLGFSGEVVIVDEYSEWRKFVLKEGRVLEFLGYVEFSEEPVSIYLEVCRRKFEFAI